MKRKTKTVQEAEAKLQELLHCGNERVELAAAKELMALAGAQAEESEDGQPVQMQVTIQVVE